MDKTAKPPITNVGPDRQADAKQLTREHAEKTAKWIKGTVQPTEKK